MERVMGIEPTYSAWKAAALPLSYTRNMPRIKGRAARCKLSDAPFLQSDAQSLAIGEPDRVHSHGLRALNIQGAVIDEDAVPRHDSVAAGQCQINFRLRFQQPLC